MQIIKNSEKVVIWLHRAGITQSQMAAKLGINRQNFSKKIKENDFSSYEIEQIKRIIRGV